MVKKQDWFAELKAKNARIKKPIPANTNPLPKTVGCSEIFTLDSKGKIIKKEWKCEEIKNWVK
jgi:hypothetical protein